MLIITKSYQLCIIFVAVTVINATKPIKKVYLTARIKNTFYNERKNIGSINPTEGGELRARPVFKTIRHNGVMETEAGTRAESVSTSRKRRHGFEARKIDFFSYFLLRIEANNKESVAICWSKGSTAH